MKRQVCVKDRFTGLATFCVGGGMGIATVVERV